LFSRRRSAHLQPASGTRRRKWLGGVCDWSPAAATQGGPGAAGAPLIGAAGPPSRQAAADRGAAYRTGLGRYDREDQWLLAAAPAATKTPSVSARRRRRNVSLSAGRHRQRRRQRAAIATSQSSDNRHD